MRLFEFLRSRRGINTVEIVIILAVVVGIAIIFREQIGKFANSLMETVFDIDVSQFSSDGMKNIP
ncbi:MAG: hypothetical protein GX184_02705 [Clostridiaceae bacterium]|nr:hypothetical protein [Clostridiaceae bacterium]